LFFKRTNKKDFIVFNSIKSKFLTATLIGVILITIILVSFISNESKTQANNSAVKSLNMLSEAIANTLTTSMKLGVSEEIHKAVNISKKIPGVRKLIISRSKKVIEMAGSNQKMTNDKDILKVFQTKKNNIIEDFLNGERRLRILRPFIANADCLSCHYNAQIGDALGVMDLELSLKESDQAIVEASLKTTMIMIVGSILGLGAIALLLQVLISKPLVGLSKVSA
jgi:methyl-accepting chemotaxis protein